MDEQEAQVSPLPQNSGRRVIVGLGNPGKEYEGTRHNIGFDAIDQFARVNKIAFGKLTQGSVSARERIRNVDTTIVKPMTYMNLSGEPLSKILRNTPINPSEVMIVLDDIHLPIGKIRIRPGGSDGGHNGLKSITSHLKTQGYPRLRIGVGEPGAPDRQIDFVLGKFSKSERQDLDEVQDRVVAALELWLTDGTEAAMNRFNGG